MALTSNTVHYGDCLDLMPLIDTGAVDLIICDLPYGVLGSRWDSVIPIAPLWAAYRRIIKPNGAILLFAQQPFATALAYPALDILRYEYVWVKERATGFLNCNRAPLKDHETVQVFYSKQPTYNPQMSEGKPYRASHKPTEHYSYAVRVDTVNTGTRHPRTVQHCNTERTGHPTGKPTVLIEKLIRTYTNAGETVLDNCMGGGSTAIAAMRCDRRWIGIEQDAEYVTMAMKRIEDEKNNNA